MINGTALSGSLGMILASRPVVPPRKGAFSLYTLIPLNSFFCYLLQEPLWQQRGSLFVEKPGCAIQEATGFLAYSE